MKFVNLKKIENENITDWKISTGWMTQMEYDEGNLGSDEKITIHGEDEPHLVCVFVRSEKTKLSKFCDVIDVKYLTKIINKLQPGMTSEQIETIFHETTENSTSYKRKK